MNNKQAECNLIIQQIAAASTGTWKLNLNLEVDYLFLNIIKL